MIVLTWDNPPELYDRPARVVRVLRRPVSPGPMVAVDDDSTWGFCLDHEESSLAAYYQVEYLGNDDAILHTISDSNIRRYARPAGTCLVTFDMADDDGGPGAGRVITVTDSASDGSRFNKTVVTNRDGRAQLLLRHGALVLVRVVGDMHALSCVVPALPEIDWSALPSFGSWLDTDRRGWF